MGVSKKYVKLENKFKKLMFNRTNKVRGQAVYEEFIDNFSQNDSDLRTILPYFREPAGALRKKSTQL
jgi:hypothetical protein